MTNNNDLATIKRLLLMADREGYAIVMAKAHAAIEKLEANNARLREALEQIKGYSEVNGMTRQRMKRIARAALQETSNAD